MSLRITTLALLLISCSAASATERASPYSCRDTKYPSLMVTVLADSLEDAREKGYRRLLASPVGFPIEKKRVVCQPGSIFPLP